MIIAVVSLMLGPVMMMQPSKKERRLARIRGSAIANKLKVQSHVDDKGEMYAVYTKPWPDYILQSLKSRQFPEWRLNRMAFAHDIHFHSVWDWDNKSKTSSVVPGELAAILDSVNEDITAIEVNRFGASVHWNEYLRGREPQQVIKEIEQLLASLIQVEIPLLPC